MYSNSSAPCFLVTRCVRFLCFLSALVLPCAHALASSPSDLSFYIANLREQITALNEEVKRLRGKPAEVLRLAKEDSTFSWVRELFPQQFLDDKKLADHVKSLINSRTTNNLKFGAFVNGITTDMFYFMSEFLDDFDFVAEVLSHDIDVRLKFGFDKAHTIPEIMHCIEACVNNTVHKSFAHSSVVLGAGVDCVNSLTPEEAKAALLKGPPPCPLFRF